MCSICNCPTHTCSDTSVNSKLHQETNTFSTVQLSAVMEKSSACTSASTGLSGTETNIGSGTHSISISFIGHIDIN